MVAGDWRGGGGIAAWDPAANDHELKYAPCRSWLASESGGSVDIVID
jgi:hypothetical protein